MGLIKVQAMPTTDRLYSNLILRETSTRNKSSLWVRCRFRNADVISLIKGADLILVTNDILETLNNAFDVKTRFVGDFFDEQLVSPGDDVYIFGNQRNEMVDSNIISTI